MQNYQIKKPFGQFKIGDEVTLNLRQAKYRLMSRHIAAVTSEAQAVNIVELPATETAAEIIEAAKPHECRTNNTKLSDRYGLIRYQHTTGKSPRYDGRRKKQR